jgi:hemoglobin
MVTGMGGPHTGDARTGRDPKGGGTTVQDTRAATAEAVAEESLYRRLGGYDAIAAATDDLLARLMGDPQLKDYWKGASLDNRRKARQLIVDFMVEAAGGPAYYVGRDMRTSHVGMRISESDWAVFMRHATATLDHLAVPTREKGEVLAFFTSLEGEIVDRG